VCNKHVNNTYKITNKIIARRISIHLEKQNLYPAEQKGCHPGTRGYKDQIMLPKAIYENYKMRKKNLSVAWIDYQKAFDSFPCGLVENSIELVAANSKIVRF
jgi:hypothetical protein